jgi:signal peptidase I
MKRKRLLSIVIIVVMVTAVFAIRTKFERFVIPQNGMFPNIPAGSTRWVTKNPYRSVEDISVGDVILFRREIQGRRYNFIWRVIAHAGDEVMIQGNQIRINGALLHHELLRTEDNMDIFLERNGEREYEVAYDSNASEEDRMGADLVVPTDHVFVLGDNRYHAKDSRDDGPVPFASIFGKL